MRTRHRTFGQLPDVDYGEDEDREAEHRMTWQELKEAGDNQWD